MGRMWSCGFELGSTASNVEMSTLGAPLIESTIKHSGDFCMEVSSLVSGSALFVTQTIASPAADGPYYYRIYARFDTLPTAENCFFAVMNATTRLAFLTIDSGGLLRLYDEDGVIGSPSSALSTSTWYRINVLFDGTPAAGSDVVRAYVDGVEFAGAANRSISLATDAFRLGGNLAAEAQTQGVWYFDDLAVNDSTGSVQNSHPGACDFIRHMHPDAAGDAAATAGTFADIDEVPPDDATSFIQLDTAIAADYAFESWANAGGSAGDTITLVHVGTRQRCETAAGANWTVHIKSQSGGTATTGPTISHNDTTWRTNGDANPRNYPCTAYVDPQGGGAWTPTLLGTAIAGVTSLGADPDIHFTAIWILVEGNAAPPSDQHDPFVTIQFRAA